MQKVCPCECVFMGFIANISVFLSFDFASSGEGTHVFRFSLVSISVYSLHKDSIEIQLLSVCTMYIVSDVKFRFENSWTFQLCLKWAIIRVGYSCKTLLHHSIISPKKCDWNFWFECEFDCHFDILCLQMWFCKAFGYVWSTQSKNLNTR